MINLNKKSLLYSLLAVLMFASSCTIFKKNKSSEAGTGKSDTVAVIKPYGKIITKEAVSDTGLFTVHKVDKKYFFEIPDSILQREILVVTRFIKTPVGAINYGGEQISERAIFWEKGPGDKIFLRVATMLTRADEEDAISKAVNNSSVTPIMEAFEIKAINETDSAYVIDVTDFLNSENNLLALSKAQKDAYHLSSLEKDKSYIKEITSYPINTEIKTVKTYNAKDSKDKRTLLAAQLSGVVTLEINNSWVLLPKTPMKKRYFDARVGYFGSSYYEFGDDQQRVSRNTFIHRWRLEPKEEDIEKWKNGELVEPKKPIVYYIDPATPEKWRPYLIQRINDWQVAFESAGFKNAIIGKEWPVDNDTMSLEDARFSVIRYFASPIKNAYGPNVVDPRSGEILESHLGWYHNIMELLHNWYMVQVGNIDPRAQKMKFDDDLMGELIRYVSSHEIGHTLGLRHNKGASYATPVEKLRDNEWLEKHGHSSSIMDYARFNYVAQPEDNISTKNIIPKIGDYDKWAIQWGYTLFPEDQSAKAEKEMLSKLVTDSVSSNPRLWFGGEGRDYDPRSQSEDLGDNAMIASTYGIKNLQAMVPQLLDWTKEKDSDDYETLSKVYKEVLRQYDRYLYHVIANIGGIYTTPQTVGQGEDVYAGVLRVKQKEALAFLDANILNEPKTLFSVDILNKIKAPQGKDPLTEVVESVMASLLNGGRIARIGFIADRFETEASYRPEEYMDDLSGMVWKELDNRQSINSYRRNLQKAYVVNLLNLYNPSKAKGGMVEVLFAKLGESYTFNTDIRAIALGQIQSLHKKIKANIPVVKDRMTQMHLSFLDQQIEDAMGND